MFQRLLVVLLSYSSHSPWLPEETSIACLPMVHTQNWNLHRYNSRRLQLYLPNIWILSFQPEWIYIKKENSPQTIQCTGGGIRYYSKLTSHRRTNNPNANSSPTPHRTFLHFTWPGWAEKRNPISRMIATPKREYNLSGSSKKEIIFNQ